MTSMAVVLATRERPEAMRRLLPEVLAQAPASAEVVIVDQSSPSARAAIADVVRHLGDSRVVHRPHLPPGLPEARNVGVRSTMGRVVLFLDDDVTLHPGCLAAHLAAFRDPKVGGVVGRIVEARLRPNAWMTTNRVGWTGRIRTRLDGPDAQSIETLKGANMSLRRSALMVAGGFDPGFGGTALLEDADLSLRVRAGGWALRYEPDAAVTHHHAPTGGVRTDGLDAVWWRFHNTGRFVGRHYGPLAVPALGLTFGALALREGLRQCSVRRAVRLGRALLEGWRATSTPNRACPSTGGEP